MQAVQAFAITWKGRNKGKLHLVLAIRLSMKVEGSDAEMMVQRERTDNELKTERNIGFAGIDGFDAWKVSASQLFEGSRSWEVWTSTWTPSLIPGRNKGFMEDMSTVVGIVVNKEETLEVEKSCIYDRLVCVEP